MKNSLKQFKDIIGLKIYEAGVLHEHYFFRIAKLDGKHMIFTMEFRANRVNVAVQDDIITEVLNIG